MVFIAGTGDNIFNITVGLEADNSVLEDSYNNNTVKIYIGERNGSDMVNSPVSIVGGTILPLLALHSLSLIRI